MDRALANPVNEAETEEMVVLEAQRVTVGRLSSSLSTLIK
jgi:ribosomal protein L13